MLAIVGEEKIKPLLWKNLRATWLKDTPLTGQLGFKTWMALKYIVLTILPSQK